MSKWELPGEEVVEERGEMVSEKKGERIEPVFSSTSSLRAYKVVMLRARGMNILIVSSLVYRHALWVLFQSRATAPPKKTLPY